MPQLEYMVLADYVRRDGGVIHIMGAGIDTVFAPVVPTVQPLGVALRISFGTTEAAGEQHLLKVSYIGPDEPVMTATATFQSPERNASLPVHWRTSVGVAVQLPVPLPRYGDYSCEVDIDEGDVTKSFEFRVITPPDTPSA